MRFRSILWLTRIISSTLIALTFLLSVLAVATTKPILYWYPSNTNLPTNNVETLAAAPLSATILYAGTWGDGVFRSTDHGATWQPANTGITMPLRIQGGLAVNPVTPL